MRNKQRRRSKPQRGIGHSRARISRKYFFTLKRYLPLMLILVGLMVIFSAFFMRFYSSYRQKQLVQKYETTMKDADSVSVTMHDSTEDQQTEESAVQTQEEDTAQSNALEDMQLLGVLTIPKIDLTVAVGEGTGNDTLKYAVGHFEDTALPGETGNSCIAGHRNYTWGKFFNRLDEVETGDEIRVERDGTLYSYTVTDTFIVNPEDLWVLDQTEDTQITLITCTPMYSATQRLIVRGSLNN